MYVSSYCPPLHESKSYKVKYSGENRWGDEEKESKANVLRQDFRHQEYLTISTHYIQGDRYPSKMFACFFCLEFFHGWQKKQVKDSGQAVTSHDSLFLKRIVK